MSTQAEIDQLEIGRKKIAVRIFNLLNVMATSDRYLAELVVAREAVEVLRSFSKSTVHPHKPEEASWALTDFINWHKTLAHGALEKYDRTKEELDAAQKSK